MDERDDKEVSILGRVVRWTKDWIEYEADPKNRQIILEYFGLEQTCNVLAVNGDKEGNEEEGDEVALGRPRHSGV